MNEPTNCPDSDGAVRFLAEEDFFPTPERIVIFKIIRIGYAPSFDRGTISCDDSDGRWRHLACGIVWLAKPNRIAR